MANGAVMSDEFHFNGEDDAKAEIRAAVRYLLEGTSGSDRGDILQEIIAIVNEVARGQRPGHDPLDDDVGRWVMWKLFTRNESLGPDIRQEPHQYPSKNDALQQAWELMYGPTRRPYTKVLYIEESGGERVERDEIDTWCKQRSSKG